MRIEWNKENNTIHVGNLVFDSYRNWKDWKSWALHVVNNQDVNRRRVSSNQHPKNLNKLLADELGCSPVLLYKNFQKLQYKVFVGPYKDILMKIAFSKGRVNTDALINIRKHYDILLQARKDGLHNLLPIIAKTGMSPQELKAQYKKDWKVIAKNSLNKNKALAKLPVHAFAEYCTLPTTLITKARHTTLDALKYAEYNFKGKWSHIDSITKGADIDRSLRLFTDTRRMAEQLGEEVNPKWTPRRVKEEHDRMAQEINARRYSPEPIECLNDVSLKNFFHEGYLATLLTSAKAIADEGTMMGHCVGGYIEAVRRGQYLVYSVTKAGERSSTIGVNIRDWLKGKTPRYFFNQQYRRFNAPVTCDAEKEISKLIIENLNKPIEKQQEIVDMECVVD